MNPLIATVVRAGLNIAAGVLATRYDITVDPDTLDAMAAGACAGLALAWSVWEKRRAARG